MRRSMRLHIGNCAQCGVLFSKRNVPSRKFCSRVCYGAYRAQTFRGEAHPTFKGRVDLGEYVRIYLPGHPLAMADGYVAEHRLVLYEAGIDIPEGSHVHHVNHDKADNRLENLAVMSASEHHKHHIEAAGGVTNQYGAWPLRRRSK